MLFVVTGTATGASVSDSDESSGATASNGFVFSFAASVRCLSLRSMAISTSPKAVLKVSTTWLLRVSTILPNRLQRCTFVSSTTRATVM